MRVAFTAEADADLERIGDWIARDNPRRADSFVEELVRKCLQIANAPKAFPLLPRHTESDIRRRVYRDYLIFYIILPDRIDVIHILHGATDYERLLFPDS
jgi:toxin ParE1/3/4